MKKVPLRQCIGCQEMKSKKEMIRVIKTAEDERQGRLPVSINGMPE